MCIAGTVLGHRNEIFHLYIPICTHTVQHVHVICAGEKKGVVDCHEHAAIVDQRANLVDEPRTFIDLIYLLMSLI